MIGLASNFVLPVSHSFCMSRAASDDELSRFHSREYVAALHRHGCHGSPDDHGEDDGESLDDAIFEFGLGMCKL